MNRMVGHHLFPNFELHQEILIIETSWNNFSFFCLLKFIFFGVFYFYCHSIRKGITYFVLCYTDTCGGKSSGVSFLPVKYSCLFVIVIVEIFIPGCLCA